MANVSETILHPIPTVDMSTYPPSHILWFTFHVDNICGILRVCRRWRDYLEIPSTSPLFPQVPTIKSGAPPLLNYSAFVARETQSHSLLSLPEGQLIMQPPWWKLPYQYAFETSSTMLSELTTPEAITILIGLVLVLRTVKSYLLPAFCQLGRVMASRTHGERWTRKHPERIHKFGEYVFRLLFHLAISWLGVHWFWNEPWWNFSSWSDSRDVKAAATFHLFSGFPHHEVTPQLTWYYLFQAAYNLDALVSLLEMSFVWVPAHHHRRSPPPLQQRQQQQQLTVRSFMAPLGRLAWSPNVRGDFSEMCLHHVITNLLVFGSSRCRLTRIGSMIFLIHDLSDVPIDMSKLANFVKWKITTVSLFCLMVVVWCWTRLYILPFVIYRGILTQTDHVCDYGLDPLLYLNYRHAFYFLVAVLIGLHTIWFGVFLQIFYSIIFKRTVEDLSEHKPGQDDASSTKSDDDDNDNCGDQVDQNDHTAILGERKNTENGNEGHHDEKKDVE